MVFLLPTAVCLRTLLTSYMSLLKKLNIIDRLSRHLSKGTPKDALNAYLTYIKKWCPVYPVGLFFGTPFFQWKKLYLYQQYHFFCYGTCSCTIWKSNLFSRWRIEEYFRSKKQMFQFENFRVRKSRAINDLNFYITLCMAFLARISMKSETNAHDAKL